LTFAACVAYRRGLKHIVGGMCETDFRDIPTAGTTPSSHFKASLNLGMEARFVFAYAR